MPGLDDSGQAAAAAVVVEVEQRWWGRQTESGAVVGTADSTAVSHNTTHTTCDVHPATSYFSLTLLMHFVD